MKRARAKVIGPAAKKSHNSLIADLFCGEAERHWCRTLDICFRVKAYLGGQITKHHQPVGTSLQRCLFCDYLAQCKQVSTHGHIFSTPELGQNQNSIRQVPEPKIDPMLLSSIPSVGNSLGPYPHGYPPFNQTAINPNQSHEHLEVSTPPASPILGRLGTGDAAHLGTCGARGAGGRLVPWMHRPRPCADIGRGWQWFPLADWSSWWEFIRPVDLNWCWFKLMLVLTCLNCLQCFFFCCFLLWAIYICCLWSREWQSICRECKGCFSPNVVIAWVHGCVCVGIRDHHWLIKPNSTCNQCNLRRGAVAH